MLLRFSLIISLVIGPALVQADFIGAKYNLYLVDTPFNTSYESWPSMQQSMATTQTLIHGANGTVGYLYDLERGGYWRRFGGHAIIIGLNAVVFDAMPGFYSWLHEEWHRAVMSKHKVKSYNEVNDWPNTNSEGGAIKVSHEKDEDLARMKAESPTDFVRLMSAGLESQQQLTVTLEKDAFFSNTRSWNLYNIVESDVNTLAYLYGCATGGLDDFSKEGERQSEKELDFTGADCTAWTYDMHRPNEAYEARGRRPTHGIRRYIKTSDLTGEELRFLKRHLWLSALNIVDPFLLYTDWYRSDSIQTFRLLHQLTSFGGDTALMWFYRGEGNWLTSFHLYSNDKDIFPGLEVEFIGYRVQDFVLSPRVMVWSQPKGLALKEPRPELGGLLDLKLGYAMQEWLEPYFFVQKKSQGWVAGVVQQESAVNLGFGVQGMY